MQVPKCNNKTILTNILIDLKIKYKELCFILMCLFLCFYLILYYESMSPILNLGYVYISNFMVLMLQELKKYNNTFIMFLVIYL